MTDYHSMSDDELCELISAKREPIPLSESKCWDFATDDIFPINWLSWENAGRLLEEMNRADDLADLHFRSGDNPNLWQEMNYVCELRRTAKVISCYSTSPTRAICEAWIMVNE